MELLEHPHKEALQHVVAGLRREAGEGRIAGTVLITVYGQTSSTAMQARNIALSRHRAHNTAEFLRCSFAGGGGEGEGDQGVPARRGAGGAAVGQEREAASFPGDGAPTGPQRRPAHGTADRAPSAATP